MLRSTHFDQRFAMVMMLAAVLSGRTETLPRAWQGAGITYTLRELAVPAGFTGSEGFGTNAHGEVAGSIETSEGISHAAVWKTDGGLPINLGLGFGTSQASAMNRRGDVVGVGDGFPVLWARGPGEYRAIVLWPGPGEASDINKKGVITGSLRDADGLPHAFVVVPEDRNGDGRREWFRDEDPPDGYNDLLRRLENRASQSSGISINDWGWVAGDPGEVIRPRDLGDHVRPELFRDKDGDDRNDLSTHFLGARDINNELQLVEDNRLIQVRVQADGTPGYLIRTLPVPRTAHTLFAQAISDAGVVVGHCFATADSRKAIRWELATGTLLLEDLVPDMGAFRQLDRATDVNFAGQIVGTGTTRTGRRGFLATPTHRSSTTTRRTRSIGE